MIGALLVLGAGDRAVLGQICTGSDGTHPRVTQDYVASGTGGYVRESSSSPGPPQTSSTFAFRDQANNQDILMADPTVLEVDGVYYLSGTTDGWAVPGSTLCTQRNYDPAHSNFAIYKTTNFRTFTFHAWAFSSTDWLPHQRIRTLNGRNFARLQSPQLFRKPYDLSHVYMVFHATEEALVPEPNAADGSLDWTTWQDPATWPSNPWNHAEVLAHPDRLVNTLWPDAAILGRYYDSNAADKLTNPAYWAPEACDYGNPAKQAKIDKFNLMSARADAYGSVFIVSVPTATFTGVSGVAFPAANPSWFGYRQGNGAGPLRYDGGVLQGNKIPIGGAASIANPNVFGSTGVTYAKQLYRCGNANTSLGMAYWNWGNLPWMFNDGFVFFEPVTHQAYLYYGWADFLCSPASDWSGNHIAYHKLRNTPGMFELDATSPSRALAFDRNDTVANRITPTNPACLVGAQPNGVIDKIGCPQPFGSAEGLAVFHWATADGGPNKYFAVYTRNMWDSPAYQVVYRVADSLDGLGLGVNFFTSPNVPAALAIQEHVLLASDAPTVTDGSSYGHVDVFRVNWPQPTGPAHRRPYLAFHAKKAGNQDRHLFFKELRWNASTGKLDQIYPTAAAGRPAWSLATQFLLPRC